VIVVAKVTESAEGPAPLPALFAHDLWYVGLRGAGSSAGVRRRLIGGGEQVLNTVSHPRSASQPLRERRSLTIT
jgi:hypothetical protein